MATRMHTLQKNNQTPRQLRFKLITVGLLLVFSGKSYSNNLTIKPSLNLSYYQVNAKSERLATDETPDNTEIDDQVISITPSLALLYTSKKLTFSTNVDHIKTQHKEKPETDENYLNYNVNSQLNIIDNNLIWVASASQSHRVADSRLGVFSDEIIGSENLTGVSSWQSGLIYQLANRRHINLGASVYVSQSKANDEPNIDLTDDDFSINAFNTSSKSASFNAGSSEFSHGVDWKVDLSMSQSDRASREDYTQSNFSTRLDIPLTQQFGWVLNASINRNKIDNDTALSDGLTYKEYGTGLRYNFLRESYLSILGYRSKTGDEEEKSYIGGEFSWVPSSRSSLLLTANRSQFGENYGLDLEQNSRFVKTRAQYSQGIEINSRQRFTSDVVGSFVCPIDTLDFAECFQPIEVDYQPQAGEQVIDVIGQDFQLNDEVVKFSTGSLSIGYDNSRKLKFNLSYRYNRQEGLEGFSVGNDREGRTVSFSAAYALSAKSQLVFNSSFSQQKYLNKETDAANGRVDDNKLVSLFLNSDLSRRLSAQLGISQRERDSNSSTLNSSDNRINVQLQYQY